MSNHKVSAMLESCRDLPGGLFDSPEEDLLKALEIEATTRRRKTVIKRLITRIAAKRQQQTKSDLTSKYLWKGVVDERRNA